MALDAQGWTILTPSGDSRLIYVSTSGSDSNDGLSDTTPKQTIAAGMALLRDGYPDWLQLKCGDTWTDETIGWTLSGRSASEPMVITSYGTGARPLLRRSGDAGVFSHTGTRHAYLSIVDIHFYGRYGTPTASSNNGISVVAPIDDLLIEGCRIENFSGGIATGGPDGTQYRLTIRRNIICDIYATDSVHANGSYFGTTEDILLEENIWDMVGWMDGNPNATGKTIFRHGAYIQTTCKNVVFRKNFVINAASNAVQVRPGGEVSDCIFSHCSIGPLIAADQPANSTGQLLTRNYVEYGQDIHPTDNKRGWGAECQDFDGGTASYNLFAHNDECGGPISIYVQRAPGSGITVDHNVIYEWAPVEENNLVIDGTEAEVAAVSLTNNQIQQPTASPNWLLKHSPNATTAYNNVTGANNQWWSNPGTGYDFYDGTTAHQFAGYMSLIGDTTSTNGAVTYTDPTRDLASYNGHLGGTATLAAFKTALRAQRKGAWNPALETEPAAAWIRAGWDMVIPGGGGGAQAVRVMALRQSTALG